MWQKIKDAKEAVVVVMFFLGLIISGVKWYLEIEAMKANQLKLIAEIKAMRAEVKEGHDKTREAIRGEGHTIRYELYDVFWEVYDGIGGKGCVDCNDRQYGNYIKYGKTRDKYSKLMEIDWQNGVTKPDYFE